MNAVPLDAPLVVRNSPRRFVLQTLVGVALVVAGAPLLVTGFALEGLLLLAIGGAILVLSVLSLRNRGPLLAADHSGVWLQAFAGPAGVRFYRWEDLHSVYVRRMSRWPPIRLLCVLPKDVQAETAANPEHRRTLEKSMQLVGAPYSVNLVAAGMSDHAALSALERLAAGRTQVVR